MKKLMFSGIVTTGIVIAAVIALLTLGMAQTFAQGGDSNDNCNCNRSTNKSTTWGAIKNMYGTDDYGNRNGDK